MDKKIQKNSKEKSKIYNNIKKFWKFIWYDDSVTSYILNLLVAFLFIKFIFFPIIGFTLNNDFPIVAIVSGSMEHKIVDHRICNQYIVDLSNKNLNQNDWWNFCGDYYEKNYNQTQEIYKNFDYPNGLNIGDVMILYGKNPKNIELGEILVFIPNDRNFFITKGPVIHRVVKKWEEDGIIYFQTKGDHNKESFNNFEQKIPESDVIGVGILRIPYLGYPKLLLSKLLGQI